MYSAEGITKRGAEQAVAPERSMLGDTKQPHQKTAVFSALYCFVTYMI